MVAVLPSKLKQITTYWCKFNINQLDEIGMCPAVYAVYHKGSLIYIGSSCRVRHRLKEHLRKSSIFFGLERKWPKPEGHYSFKIKYSQKVGDWAMWELRLINKLRPSLNRNTGLDKNLSYKRNLDA